MATRIRTLWQSFLGQAEVVPAPVESAKPKNSQWSINPPVDIAPNDPILAYFLGSPGVVDLDKVELDSPGLKAMKQAGIKLSVPLIGQGELIGLLSLGPRLSEQEYSADDRRLLNNLATQAAPALRVAQMVRQQQEEAQERERLEQELRVARVIQQTLLPKELPAPQGWQVAAHWQPARAVGGDFYDFLYLPEDHIGFLIGDVTDKGVPAAMVMATTRSILRSAATGDLSPGKVLERANDLLCPDIPQNMFVTCLYAVLDTRTGQLRYANAGHNVPYLKHGDHVHELRATGMPLGLMPGMDYEEKEVLLDTGDSVLFYSDGMVEAHNGEREMFSTPRLQELIATNPGGPALIDAMLTELTAFVGQAWIQEDDVTFVTLQRNSGSSVQQNEQDWIVLDEFALPSEPGNERLAMERIAKSLAGLGLPSKQMEQLKTAAAESTMNAMEHGNRYQPELPVTIRLMTSETSVKVQISDQGAGSPIPAPDLPDLEAKLAGDQTPRGWGLFLIQNMVDVMNFFSDENQHTIELIIDREEKGGSDAS